tara:strand:- start:7772 stop:7873 length:102 start_codon:yes stop_codon:yes gene_type:complete
MAYGRSYGGMGSAKKPSIMKMAGKKKPKPTKKK